MALIEFKNLPDTTTPINAQNLNNNFNELKNEIEGSWQNISLNTGWQNLGGTYYSAQYKLIGKKVIFRGIIKRTTGTETPFQMPSGLRPTKFTYGTAIMNDVVVPANVSTSGIAEVVGYTTDKWVDISGISYSID